MQKNTALAVGFLIVIGAVLVIVMGGNRGQSHPAAPATATVAAPSAAPSAPIPSASAIAPTPSAAGLDLEATDALTSEGFDVLPDGRKAPPLPASAPKEISFGVALFTYEGAEGAPKNAPKKEDARKHAESLIAEAKQDFAAVVAKGDPGSAADKGKMLRDTLEPAVEYQLFSLEKGAVADHPIDTPKGFWIARRNR
ncbi:MAG TPA: peptidylprolyl isomerase [Polyangiaceae bacterium]|nr:peptidylprolyl isomerase [Polyangiaceae bacterium]